MSLKRVTLLVLLAATTARAESPKTLEECFRAAIHRSELIGQQTELITQAEERYKQAKGAILPSINGIVNYLVQETPPAGTATSFAPGEQTTARLSAVQPIFHGMREYAAILQRNLLVTAQMSAKLKALQVLYSDVAVNYYTILSIEQDLRNIENEIAIDERRINDLNARVRIGRSRPSEVLNVRSTVDTLAAQAEQVRGTLLTNRDAFAFLTGFDRNTPLLDAEKAPGRLGSIDEYVAHIEERPDVKAQRDQLEAVEKNVTLARGNHLPAIDVAANYYFKRPGILSQQHWDVQILGTIPIFSGGTINSQVREAASQARGSELELGRTRRLADQEIRQLYDGTTADLAQVMLLERATESASKNYTAQFNDYRLGLVTNLDVLAATNTAQQTRRALDRAKFQAKLDFIRLQIAIAKRPSGLLEGGEGK